MNEILLALAENEGRVTSKIIHDLIQAHAPRREEMLELYYRYLGAEEGVPVLTRKFADELKVNNKLANDFLGEIVNTKFGYFAGMPIAYNVDKDADGFEQMTDTIAQFKARNNIEDLDAETAKNAAIYGIEGRLCYVDKEGDARVMQVPGWECIWVTDMSIAEPQYALRYYEIDVDGQPKYRVEWYDDTTITYYIGDRHGGYKPDGEEPHLFDEVPLVAFPNNAERQGDGEKVLTLIDGYDNTLSDVNSEIEQFRLAYMYARGVTVDDETIEQAKRTGCFEIPEDAEMGFITKTLDDGVVENHLNRVEQNILRFSNSVNFGDEAFAGNLSGVALKFKLFGLETKCIAAERKFASALRQMFRVLASGWAKRGVTIVPESLFFEFKRNFPLNLHDEAETTQVLKGLVSEQTRLSLLSFVDDAEYEQELMDAEMTVDLDEAMDEGDADEFGS